MAQLEIGASRPVIVEIRFEVSPAVLRLRSVFRHPITDTAHGDNQRVGLLARHGVTVYKTDPPLHWAFP